jgi:hypothetical protein
MYSHNVEVDILVNGRPVRKHSHKSRIFVEAKHWTEYSIRIRNNGYQRRLVVVCVDGLNVLDGEEGGSTKAGYVINGYSSYEIKGFRTSNDVVHPFKFNRKERSYAAKSDATNGDTKNCGVIGVEVYCEKEKPAPILVREVIREVPVPRPSPFPYPYTLNFSNTALSGCLLNESRTYSCNLSNSAGDKIMAGNMMRSANVTTDWSAPDDGPIACACSSMDMAAVESPKRGFDMGTEFSDREVSDKVVDTEFEIGYLMTTFTFYYASKDSLVEMGVPVTKEAAVTFPDPFPAKFCRPPRK